MKHFVFALLANSMAHSFVLSALWNGFAYPHDASTVVIRREIPDFAMVQLRPMAQEYIDYFVEVVALIGRVSTDRYVLGTIVLLAFFAIFDGARWRAARGRRDARSRDSRRRALRGRKVRRASDDASHHFFTGPRLLARHCQTAKLVTFFVRRCSLFNF